MKSQGLSGEKVEFYELLKKALKSIVNTGLNGVGARDITEVTVRTVGWVAHDYKSPLSHTRNPPKTPQNHPINS